MARETIFKIVESFNVFEAVLGGCLLRQCSYRMHISVTRCHKAVVLARQILTLGDCPWVDLQIPRALQEKHSLEVDRKYQAFWSARIAYARSRLRPCLMHRADACEICEVDPAEYLQLRSAQPGSHCHQPGK